jgi:hypothetical protein
MLSATLATAALVGGVVACAEAYGAVDHDAFMRGVRGITTIGTLGDVYPADDTETPRVFMVVVHTLLGEASLDMMEYPSMDACADSDMIEFTNRHPDPFVIVSCVQL